jgi:hypothetical protein
MLPLTTLSIAPLGEKVLLRSRSCGHLPALCPDGHDAEAGLTCSLLTQQRQCCTGSWGVGWFSVPSSASVGRAPPLTMPACLVSLPSQTCQEWLLKPLSNNNCIRELLFGYTHTHTHTHTHTVFILIHVRNLLSTHYILNNVGVTWPPDMNTSKTKGRCFPSRNTVRDSAGVPHLNHNASIK